MAGRDRAGRTRRRSRHRSCRPRSVGNGNGVGQIHSRAAAQEDVMRIQGSALILASAIMVGHVLSDVPAHAQTPAAQTPPPSRPPPGGVPQRAPPPPPPPAATTPAHPPRQAKPGEVESDPIRCWWKADRTSLRVGEKFGLVLTCSVIEAGPITVVPVLNQLEPGALSLTPFEVVSGVSHDDVVTPPWRYIQREYQVRLLSDGFFGQDVTIPALTVTYNLQERGSGSQGRDQQYILPPLPMRILSLVPKSADDIRSEERRVGKEGRSWGWT